jgi:aminobenzoyl-glutamate transport protein
MASEHSISAPANESSGGGILDRIEKLGNKVPHPAIIFVALCLIVILLSQVLSWLNISVTYDVAEPPPTSVEESDLTGSVAPEITYPPGAYGNTEYEIHEETTKIQGLLTIDGIRFLFTSFVANFDGFSVIAVIFVAMMGVGVAEGAGLMGALIRKLVKTAPAGALTFIIVLVGCLSSIATDAGYLILIPLGAAAFLSVGRHPLAGLAAAYAGVSVSFAVNILITPLDSLLTEITNEAMQSVTPGESLGITANLYFAVVSTLFTAIVVTFVTTRMIEPRLGTYRQPQLQGGSDAGVAERPREMTAEPDTAPATTAGATPEPQSEDEAAAERKGLRYALLATIGIVILIALLVAPSGAPLRDPETNDIIGDSPFMDSLIFIIAVIFFAAGIGYGLGAKTYTNSVDVINAIQNTFASLAGLIFLLLIISQFIAYFNFSEMPTVAAVKMADGLESIDVGALWLLIGLILVVAVLDIIMPGALPKWAIFAPIFIPLFVRLGVAPQTVLAAYRIGDSPMNVITPMMVYLPFIVLVAQRYEPQSGIGTIIALMVPYTLAILVAWVLFFVLWYVVGIPLGPGYPVEL